MSTFHICYLPNLSDGRIRIFIFVNQCKNLLQFSSALSNWDFTKKNDFLIWNNWRFFCPTQLKISFTVDFSLSELKLIASDKITLKIMQKSTKLRALMSSSISKDHCSTLTILTFVISLPVKLLIIRKYQKEQRTTYTKRL